MKTYTFFDFNDLQKFIRVFSYEFSNKWKDIFEYKNKLNNPTEEREFTFFINKLSDGIISDIMLDINSQIEEENKRIDGLKNKIKFLSLIKYKIKDCKTFKEAFEIISKS